MTGPHPVGIATRARDHPHFAPGRAERSARHIGGALILERLAAGESQLLRIRRPGELTDVESIIAAEGRDSASFHALRRIGDPDVTGSPCVEHPGDGLAARCRNER